MAAGDPREGFGLPPDREAHYSGIREGSEHRERMKGMSKAERAQYQRGIREGIGQGDPPTRGDIDNPLAKDQPPTARSTTRTPKAPPRSGRVRRSSRPTKPSVLNPTGNRLPIGGGAAPSLAGVFFGAIAYALVLSVVDYGPSGPLLWFKAKFLNEAVGASTTSATTSTPSSGTFA